MDFKTILKDYCLVYEPTVTDELGTAWVKKYPINTSHPEKAWGPSDETYKAYSTFSILNEDGGIAYNHGWVHCSGAMIYWVRKLLNPENVPAHDAMNKAMTAKSNYAVVPLPMEFVKHNYPNKSFAELDQMLTMWGEFCTLLGYSIYYAGGGVVTSNALATVPQSTGSPCFLFVLKRTDFVSESHPVGAMQLARYAYMENVFPVIEKALEFTKTLSPHKAMYYAMYFVNKPSQRLASFGGGKSIEFPYPDSKEDVLEVFNTNKKAGNSQVWSMFNMSNFGGNYGAYQSYGALSFDSDVRRLGEYASTRATNQGYARKAVIKKFLEDNNFEKAEALYLEEIDRFKSYYGSPELVSEYLNKCFEKMPLQTAYFERKLNITNK